MNSEKTLKKDREGERVDRRKNEVCVGEREGEVEGRKRESRRKREKKVESKKEKRKREM